MSDDGECAELGGFRGKHGDQVYLIVTGIDPRGSAACASGCRRFAASFGAAALTVVSS
jgi:hypothetical protein